MIEYVVEHACELRDFSAWSGGADILNELVNHDEAYEVAKEFIEEVISVTDSREVTDTFINDILCFGIPDILEDAGFDLSTFEREEGAI